MAYNNGFPMTYQPIPMVQPNVPNQQYMSNGQLDIIQVQGKDAAKMYPVARNSSVILFDSEGDFFYIKATDMSGMPQKLRMFAYKEIFEDGNEDTSAVNEIHKEDPNYVTRNEFQNLENVISDLSSQIAELTKLQNELLEMQTSIDEVVEEPEEKKKTTSTKKTTTTRKAGA